MITKPITGRTVFIITASAFAVIIAVNVFMATMAIGTFPGLETKNSYVASQKFDADRAAQLDLGWQVSAEVAGTYLRLSILDADGRPVDPATLEATLGRATHVGEDQTPAFTFDGTAHVAPIDLAPGNWNLRMTATAKDGTAFRQRVVLYVDEPK
ncbi:MAG: FixH family protein [Rhodobacter sp.]|nr:FixH family protein [Rhodobacter sp.]